LGDGLGRGRRWVKSLARELERTCHMPLCSMAKVSAAVSNKGFAVNILNCDCAARR